jgi:hypothetical protein
MVFLEQDVCDESFQPPLFYPFYSTTDTVGNFSHASHLLIVQICFQPMACHEGFWFHTYDQQASGWEKNFYSRPGLTPFFAFFCFPWVASESSIDSFSSLLLNLWVISF